LEQDFFNLMNTHNSFIGMQLFLYTRSTEYGLVVKTTFVVVLSSPGY